VSGAHSRKGGETALKQSKKRGGDSTEEKRVEDLFTLDRELIERTYKGEDTVREGEANSYLSTLWEKIPKRGED